ERVAIHFFSHGVQNFPRGPDAQVRERSAVSSCLSSAGSIFAPPRKIASTVCDRAALVLLTDSFRRSASVGSGLPKSVIIRGGSEVRVSESADNARQKCSRSREFARITRAGRATSQDASSLYCRQSH